MPWIYNEDSALKMKLQGLTVTDPNAPIGGRTVPVRYRLPEDELATLTYPCIIIEHLPFSYAPERAHSGWQQIPYCPEGAESWWPAGAPSFKVDDSPYWDWFPQPVNFDYQITVYCRKMAGHLQPLMAQLAGADYLPYKWGCLNIPQDGTTRNMFLIGGPETEYGKDKDNKRLFRCTYRIRVMTEVPPNINIFPPITEIDVDLGVYRDVTDIQTKEVDASFGIIATGPQLAWNVTAS